LYFSFILKNHIIDLVHRNKIETMAVVSMDKCRRDTLWNRLLMNPEDEKTSKKKSDADKRDV